MRLLAIGDLHVGHPANRAALAEVPPHPDDWLLVLGDVGETRAHLDLAQRATPPGGPDREDLVGGVLPSLPQGVVRRARLTGATPPSRTTARNSPCACFKGSPSVPP